MIDRPLVTPNGNGLGGGLGGAAVTIPYSAGDATTRELPDGSVEVTLGGQRAASQALAEAPFEANLAEYLPEQVLQSIASELRAAVEEDKQSRSEWELALSRGMDLLGIKSEDRDDLWKGACGIVHPMILEAAVRFQSKSIMRLFPPDGPASAKILGQSSEEKIQQAKRVAADLNNWLTEKMPEYRDETEQLLFALPVDGSAFKKCFYDLLLERPVAQFVPASDFLMPYGFPNLETCPRYTHVMRKAYGDIVRLQNLGFYRDIQLARGPIEIGQVEEKVVRLGGIEPSYTLNDLVTLWEVHTNLELDVDGGEPSPYVVTLEHDSSQVLALRRNWRDGDPLRAKVQSFIHYRYVPWKGAYGLGLVHLIGGITKGTTSVLRQLVDAGTLSNLPGGLKSRQMRVLGEDDPIRPGEFRDVDVPAGKILDSIAFIPYKEPSAVLFQLMQLLIEEGKGFASIAELDLTTSTENAPVGTMLALIERATEVITAVQSRMHTALARELVVVAEIVRDHTPGEYDYDPPNHVPRSTKAADYGEASISIMPVSDPAAATMAQRVMQYQAALQTASQAPQLYDLPLLHRSLLEVLGIDNADQIVPDKSAAEPMDPVSENMALLTSKPVKAFEWQDHDAHLAVHQALDNDPKVTQIMQQNPLAASISQAGAAHIAEHLAFKYRQQIEQELGVPLPPLGAKLPPEVENQLATAMAAASQKVLAANQAAAQQAQQGGPGGQPDPIVEQAQAELALKRQQLQQKAQADQGKLELEGARIQQKAQSDQARLASEERRTQAEIAAGNLRHGVSEHAETERAGMSEHAQTTRHLMEQRTAGAQMASDERQNLISETTPEPLDPNAPAAPPEPPLGP